MVAIPNRAAAFASVVIFQPPNRLIEQRANIMTDRAGRQSLDSRDISPRSGV
jgi:hypothetical protein